MGKFSELIHGKEEKLNNGQSETPTDFPPTYDELEQVHSDGNSAPGYTNNGPKGYPEDKKHPDGPQEDPQQWGQPPQGAPQQWGQPPQWEQQGGPSGYDPMKDPNVYKVPPQMVNITQANPQHLNPQYQEYLQRDQERVAHGDYPKGPEFYGRKGAPLSPSQQDPNNKTGGGAFPGKSGVSYHNAANK